MFAFRISAPENELPTTLDRLEGGPDDDSPMCGTHGENYFVGGTSEQNLDYTCCFRELRTAVPPLAAIFLKRALTKRRNCSTICPSRFTARSIATSTATA